jgi:hypothetical protein
MLFFICRNARSFRVIFLFQKNCIEKVPGHYKLIATTFRYSPYGRTRSDIKLTNENLFLLEIVFGKIT